MRNTMSAGLLPGLHDGLRVGGRQGCALSASLDICDQRNPTSAINESRVS